MNPGYIALGIGICCVILVFTWFRSHRAKRLVKEITPILGLVANVAALLVFVQFYQEARKQADETAKQAETNLRDARAARARFNARLATVATELINNIKLCNLINDAAQKYGLELKIPGPRFQFDAINGVLVDGSITHHKLRARLLSVKMQAEAMNRQMNDCERVFEDSRSFPANSKEQSELWIKAWMEKIKINTAKTREAIVSIEPLLEEFWQSPDKFNEESYLRSKLVEEGQIE